MLGWTLPVWFITFLQGNLLTLIERQKAVAVVGLVNMILNVGLNLYHHPALRIHRRRGDHPDHRTDGSDPDVLAAEKEYLTAADG